MAAYCLREKGQRGGRIETDGLAQAFCGIPFEPALSGAKIEERSHLAALFPHGGFFLSGHPTR